MTSLQAQAHKMPYLLTCWEDDTRMSMLFSEFRCESVNPAGWNDKMNFWSYLITDYCHQTKSVVISHEDLCEAFQRKGSFPQCLKSVLEHMYRLGSITKLSDFSKSPQRKGWMDWGFDVFLQTPVSWGLSAVKGALRWNQQGDKYVVISVIKDLAFKVSDRHNELVNSQWTDNVVCFKTLEEQCSDICADMNLQLALMQLQKQNEVTLLEEEGQQFVKFKRKDEPAVQPFSELDRGILRLQKARELTQSEIDKIELDINSCIEDARSFVKIGLKTKAMISLKKKKRLEKLLQKKISSYDNIECLLGQLQDSGSEKMVLDAYNAGVSAMKTAVKGDLDLDRIYSTMADVEEMMDSIGDVQEAISRSVSPQEFDLSDLELELDELLSNSKGLEEPSGVCLQTGGGTIGFEEDESNIPEKLLNLPLPPEGLSPIAEKRSTLNKSQSSETSIPL